MSYATEKIQVRRGRTTLAEGSLVHPIPVGQGPKNAYLCPLEKPTTMPTNNVDAPTLLIFDLDGTLYRTETSFAPAVAQILRTFSLPVPPDEALYAFIGEPFDVFVEWLERLTHPANRDKLCEMFTEAELRFVRDCGALYPGVRDTLARLRDRGCRLTLCTNAGALYAKTVLSACGIENLFRTIRYRRTNDGTKSEMVAELTKQTAYSRAFVIGDRYHDLLAGRRAGCTVIGAGYGYARPGELAAADHLISSFAELLPLV